MDGLLNFDTKKEREDSWHRNHRWTGIDHRNPCWNFGNTIAKTNSNR